MAGLSGLFKNLLGVGFLSAAWNDFKQDVVNKEDKKFRDKNKKAADKYAKAYTKNMDKEISPGITLRAALEAERNHKKPKPVKDNNSNKNNSKIKE